VSDLKWSFDKLPVPRLWQVMSNEVARDAAISAVPFLSDKISWVFYQSLYTSDSSTPNPTIKIEDQLRGATLWRPHTDEPRKNHKFKKKHLSKVDISVFQYFTNMPIAPNTNKLKSQQSKVRHSRAFQTNVPNTKTASDVPKAVKKMAEVGFGENILIIWGIPARPVGLDPGGCPSGRWCTGSR
jgi:hypothetical protein